VVFIGQFNHNLDSKNRLIIPANYRKDLGDTFYLSKGNDGAIYLYPKETFEALIAKVLQLNRNKAEVRMYIHNLSSNAVEVSLDKMGRVQVPQFLKEMAAIEKECVIAGEFSHIAIFSKENFVAFNDKSNLAFDDISEMIEV